MGKEVTPVVKHCVYCGKVLKVTPRYDIKKFCNRNCSHEYYSQLSVNISIHRDTKEQLIKLKGDTGTFNEFINELIRCYKYIGDKV